MARRNRDVPQEPGYVPYQPPEERVLHRLSENGEIIAYTDREYGVRKDDGLGVIKPVNTSGGLLFLAILASLFCAGLVYGLIRIAVEGTWSILGEVWWVIPVGIFVPLAAWSGYVKERKAEKLRKAGNLPRPVE